MVVLFHHSDQVCEGEICEVWVCPTKTCEFHTPPNLYFQDSTGSVVSKCLPHLGQSIIACLWSFRGTFPCSSVQGLGGIGSGEPHFYCMGQNKVPIDRSWLGEHSGGFLFETELRKKSCEKSEIHAFLSWPPPAPPQLWTLIFFYPMGQIKNLKRIWNPLVKLYKVEGWGHIFWELPPPWKKPKYFRIQTHIQRKTFF